MAYSLLEAADSGSGATTSLRTATLALTDAADTLALTGIVANNNGTMAIQDAADSCPMVGNATQVIGNQLLLEDPNWYYASVVLQTPWSTPGGDYTAMGATPVTVSQFGATLLSFEAKSLATSLLAVNTGIFLHLTSSGAGPHIYGNNDPIPPILQIVTTTGTFDCAMSICLNIDITGNTANYSNVKLPSVLMKPILTAVTGTVQSATLKVWFQDFYSVPVTMAADKLRMPVPITDPAIQIGNPAGGLTAQVGEAALATHPSVIFYNAPISATQMAGVWDNWYSNTSTFITWPEFGGVNAIRLEARVGPTASSWIRHFPQQPDELYARYTMMVDTDYLAGYSDAVKLPGLSGTYYGIGQYNETHAFDATVWEARMHHTLPSAANSMVRYNRYDYYAGNPQGAGLTAQAAEGEPPANAWFRLGQKYNVEQHIKLNTQTGATWNSDGIEEIFIDGVLVYQNLAMKWRADSRCHIDEFFHNFYQGGVNAPRAPIHWECGPVVCATQYIGPLQRTAATPTFPTWRRGLAKDVVATIANTGSMNGLTSNVATVNAWCGFAAGPTTWYSAANGGHSDSGENKVIKIDLSANAPAWTLLHPGSNPSAYVETAEYYSDGLPSSRHSYYSAQYNAQRNRVMLFASYGTYGGVLLPRPGGGPAVNGFNLATNVWDAQGTWSNAPALYPGSFAAFATCTHPTTGDVYYAAQAYAKWTQATNTWSFINPVGGDPGAWQFHGSLIDINRNRWVNYSELKTLRFIDLTNSNFTSLAVTGPVQAAYDYSQIVHDLDNDRYITVQGSQLCSIDPTTGASVLLATVPFANNGVNGRLAYFQTLGGIAYLPDFASNVLFIPTR